jgi:predicted transcriptional regulator
MIPHNSNLSTREKIVLSSIIAYPYSNDVDIANNSGIKHSTFATVKKRLIKNKMFMKIYFPNFAALNAEIFSINTREISTYSSSQNIDPNIINEFGFHHNEENLLITGIDGNIAIGVSIVRNYSDLLRNHWKFDRIARKSDTIFNFQHNLSIPISHSTFHRVLDFSRSVPQLLDVEIAPIQPKPLFRPLENPLSITKLGWEIYLAFLDNPGFSPKNISNLLDKPRTTTTRWLRSFLQSGLLTPQIVPNLRKLGYKLCLIMHLEVFSTMIKHEEEVPKIIDEIISPEFLVHSYKNVLFTSMFSSFDDVRNAEEELAFRINKMDIKFKIVYRFLFSIPNIRFLIALDRSLGQIAKNLGIPKSVPTTLSLNQKQI